MPTLIYFTRELPGINAELEQAGFQVFEALAISEVFSLIEQHPAGHIIIDPTVEDDAAQQIGAHYPTMRLKPGATAADVAWELSGLDPSLAVQ